MVKIFVLKKLSALETIYFQQPTLHGKNNGFTTNDWQENHIFGDLVGSVQQELCSQFLPKANFVLGALKIVPSQTKFEKWQIYLRADPH